MPGRLKALIVEDEPFVRADLVFLLQSHPNIDVKKEAETVTQAKAALSLERFDVVFLDEPTTGFDPAARRKSWDLVAGLRSLGTTILLTTHYMDEAATLCDRIAIMYLGRIMEIGPLNEVFQHPVHPYTVSLMAAVPVPDPKFRRTQPIPKGEIPSAIDPPAGCRFHPRCPHVMARCKEGKPPEQNIGEQHQVACYLHVKETPDLPINHSRQPRGGQS